MSEERKPGFYTWIDQEICTGDGICQEICPQLYFGSDDGLFYVKEVDEKANIRNPRLKGAKGLALVPEDLLEAAVEAATECPGECIFFEKES